MQGLFFVVTVGFLMTSLAALTKNYGGNPNFISETTVFSVAFDGGLLMGVFIIVGSTMIFSGKSWMLKVGGAVAIAMAAVTLGIIGVTTQLAVASFILIVGLGLFIGVKNGTEPNSPPKADSN